jgi:hypothetical protein
MIDHLEGDFVRLLINHTGMYIFSTGIIDSDIPGLSFLNQPLKFLGIFNCDSSSQYKNIPAERISGDHGEDQVITAMEMYLERPKTMQAVLNESYQLYRFGTNLVNFA